MRPAEIAPSAARIDGSLERLGVHGLEAVLPVHTHFDHAMDSAVVAQRTGARIVGGESAAQVGIGGSSRSEAVHPRHVSQVSGAPRNVVRAEAHGQKRADGSHRPKAQGGPKLFVAAEPGGVIARRGFSRLNEESR